jgi:hypothetical protein
MAAMVDCPVFLLVGAASSRDMDGDSGALYRGETRNPHRETLLCQPALAAFIMFHIAIALFADIRQAQVEFPYVGVVTQCF